MAVADLVIVPRRPHQADITIADIFRQVFFQFGKCKRTVLLQFFRDEWNLPLINKIK